MSNIEIDFIDCHIYWRLYTIAEILLITRWIELIEKKEFVATTLDIENKTFVNHIASISLNSDIYSFRKAQIASLKVD